MKPSCAKFHDNTEQIHIAWSNVKMEEPTAGHFNSSFKIQYLLNTNKKKGM